MIEHISIRPADNGFILDIDEAKSKSKGSKSELTTRSKPTIARNANEAVALVARALGNKKQGKGRGRRISVQRFAGMQSGTPPTKAKRTKRSRKR